MPISRIERKHIIIAIIIFVQTVFGVFGGVVAASTSGNDRIFPGVFISGTDVGNLTPAEAEAKLRQRVEPALDGDLIVQFKNKQWKVAYSDLEIQVKYRPAAWAAYKFGRETNPVTRVISSFKLRGKRNNFDLDITYNENRAKELFAMIAGEINRSGRDARAVWQNGRIKVTSEQTGMELDTPAALMLIKDAVKSLGGAPVFLPVKQVKPRVTARDLALIKDELAAFTTVFNLAKENRAHNIRLAAQFLDNSVVKGGEVFSFNKQVGPRMEKFGYREAPVIANNKLQPGIGGGVCQVSTTLYQALLYSGFSAKTRTPHSKPPVYVPLGQDAAVADNQIDFTFQNTNSSPIMISTEVKGNKLTVRIFGKREHYFVVKLSSENIRKIEPETITVTDPSLVRGSKKVTKGESGFRVKVYRSIIEKGIINKKELISEDYYRPTDTIVRVGIQ